MSNHFKIIETKQWHQDGSWVAIMGSLDRRPTKISLGEKKIDVSRMIVNLKEKCSIFCKQSPSDLDGSVEKWDDVHLRGSEFFNENKRS